MCVVLRWHMMAETASSTIALCYFCTEHLSYGKQWLHLLKDIEARGQLWQLERTGLGSRGEHLSFLDIKIQYIPTT